MPKVRDIPFRGIPKQSRLFLEYLDLSPAALRFFQHAPTIENLELRSRKIGDLQFSRQKLAAMLRKQNESFGTDTKTLDQISELEKPDCVAVLTGQQVGLFGGPLYTVYKAWTAIRMAENLNSRGLRAVPVFWMETEDHDLSEAMHQTVLDPLSSVHAADYRKSLFPDESAPNSAVGSILFPPNIRQVVLDYITHLPDSVQKPGVQALLESTYKPASTFAESFARLLSELFRGSGLILFDPHDTEAKSMVTGVFEWALTNATKIRASLWQRNQELEAAGFHAQVNILDHSTVLFLFDNGRRRALEQRESGFGLRGNDQVLQIQQLTEEARRSPGKFSPNVLLRPIIQDCLFPTVAYVGGSSELAYFAQIETLYALCGRPMPVIWPRNSFTLLEPEICLLMDSLGLRVEDCFAGKQAVLEKAIRNSGQSISGIRLQNLIDHLEQSFAEMRSEVQATDPPSALAFETAKRKILHNLRHLRSQVIRAEGTRNISIAESVTALVNNCFPNQNLQERELGIFHFWARHGSSLPETLHSATEISNWAHRIVSLEE
jgi:bacillithiol synthase